MVERRVSSGGDGQSGHTGNGFDAEDEPNQIARLLEEAWTNGVRVPYGASIEEIQSALLQNSSVQRQQVQAANIAYDEYIANQLAPNEADGSTFDTPIITPIEPVVVLTPDLPTSGIEGIEAGAITQDTPFMESLISGEG